MKTFEEALREQITADGKRKFRYRRVLNVLDAPPSDRRTRILQRWERLTALHLEDEGVSLPTVTVTESFTGPGNAAGTREVQKIDWSQVDWAKLFETIIKFLMVLLPLFI